METTNLNKAILAVAILIFIGVLYNTFTGQSKLSEANKKIEAVQTELTTIKGNLNQSIKQLDGVVSKLSASESNLTVVRKQVELIDTKYEQSREKSKIKLDSLKKEAQEQIDELEKLKRDLQLLK
jgi:chromosome segregation ATPase